MESAIKTKKQSRVGGSLGGKLFDLCNVAFMILLCAATIYPFWYVLVYALNDGHDAMRGPIWFWPRHFTLANFQAALDNPYMTKAFVVTVGRVLIGTLFSLAVNVLAAYALSKRDLPGRKAVTAILILPLFIGGTVISHYVVIAKLGLLNNFLVYIVPGAFGFFTMVMMRTFIEQLPDGIEESAMIDGAGYVQTFGKIVLPLCKPILAAFGFFAVVGHWLDFGTTLLYITDKTYYTLQYVLYMVIKSNEADAFMQLANSTSGRAAEAASIVNQSTPTPEVIKMAVLVIVTVPLLAVYPFFQKYFVKGMFVGAIKA